MKRDNENIWTYPGSRWWKFDFHTHTPASHDTVWRDELTPEKWLLKYMKAGVDCVAITDHNSGEWIDKLQGAYEQMSQLSEEKKSNEGFRELTLFPGVEISVNGGFHLLAIFDPSEGTRTITNLLARVGYKGKYGHSDEVTERSAFDVVDTVIEAGGIPIPAHVDQKNGLFQLGNGKNKSVLDPPTVQQVMQIEDLMAVEWWDTTLSPPESVKKKAKRMAKVLGSDCHNFRGDRFPGSHYTWIKMATPTLEGLRLALLDGNGISVRRSDDDGGERFDPFQTPVHFITSVEIDSARLMGNGTSEHLKITPYYNALIGGRGTGKSTIVHSIRLAYQREKELQYLGNETEIHQRFKSFAKPATSRISDGALRQNTKICIHLMREGIMHRLSWQQDGKGVLVEEQDGNGEWVTSSSQVISSERFPIRLFSQGQIAAMVENRQALVNVIDEASPKIVDLHRRFEEMTRTWFSQRAELRRIDGKTEERPELERKSADMNRGLEALEQSHHTEILRAYRQMLRQRREIDITLEQLQAMPNRIIESLGQKLSIDDWTEVTFNPIKDQDAIVWRTKVDQLLDETQEFFAKATTDFTEKVRILGTDSRLSEWRERAEKVQSDYQELQVSLGRQGIDGIQAFEKLTRERQQIEKKLEYLDRLQKDRDDVESESIVQWNRILDSRKSITDARKSFVEDKLTNNRFVRISIVPFGFQAHKIERSLRELLECEDDRFKDDILWVDESGEASGGIAFELAQSQDIETTLSDIKQQLASASPGLGGHFRRYLQKKLKRPEFVDRIHCWFPEDDLCIEYSRTGDGSNWSSIEQGSQGQRSAALLAFLLAFGDEPLILDQPEDDLDNHLIYELIVQQIRENKRRRQLIIVTHNPNVVINGDAEMVHALDFRRGQCRVIKRGALQEQDIREEVCRVMEGGREAFSRRWARLGKKI